MTPKQLMAAALNRKSVIGMYSHTSRMPAAFVVSMQFRAVMLSLPKMKIYKPKNKELPRWKQHLDRLNNLNTSPM